jgi:hypothetical protein
LRDECHLRTHVPRFHTDMAHNSHSLNWPYIFTPVAPRLFAQSRVLVLRLTTALALTGVTCAYH